MLCCVVFVPGNFRLLTLSTYPALLCFLYCLLNHLLIAVFFCYSAPYLFFFESLLTSLRFRTSLVNLRSPFPNILLPASVSDHHGIDVHVPSLTPMRDENFQPIKLFGRCMRLSCLFQTNAKGHQHQVMVTS